MTTPATPRDRASSQIPKNANSATKQATTGTASRARLSRRAMSSASSEFGSMSGGVTRASKDE